MSATDVVEVSVVRREAQEAAAVGCVEVQGFDGPPAGALEAILAAAEEDELRSVAGSWAQSCRPEIERFREGVALVVEVAGLPLTCFSKAGTLHPRSSLNIEAVIDATCHTVRDDVVPLPGSLADMTASQATAVARSLQMFFVFGCSTLLLAERVNSDGLILKLLLDWLPIMASTCLRCLRHAATSAGLGMLEAFVVEIRRLRAEIDASHKQLDTFGTDNEGDGNAQRRNRLQNEIKHQQHRFQVLHSRASIIRDSILRPHLRDKTPGIRLLAVNSISFLIQNDPDLYRSPPWPERILRAFCDPNAEVRFCAVQAATAWFSATEAEHESGTLEGASETAAVPGIGKSIRIGVSRQLDDLVPHAASLLVERAQDVHPKVALAAVKALRFPKLALGLGERDIDSLVALCFSTSDSILRREVAFFIDEHLLVDPGVGAATRRAAIPIRHRGAENMQPIQGSEALRNLYRSEHGLLVLTDFLVHHLKRDSFCRIERIVDALWGLAPCFQRWTTMSDLCLLGEGEGPARSVTVLPAMQRLAMLHLIDASLRQASDEYSRGENMDALEEAAKALLPRLSRLLDLFSNDEAGMKPLSMATKLVVEYSCRQVSVLPPRALVLSLAKAISKQVKLQTTENLVDALVMLARQSSEARNLIFSLVKEVRNKAESALRRHKDAAHAENLALCLVTLLALCKRGVDVSLGHYGFLSASLKYLSEAQWSEGNKQVARIAACLSLQLLQVGMLLIMWRIRAVVSAAAAETPQASRLDLDEAGVVDDGMNLCGPPASPQDREMLPHVACQLFEVSIRLLRKPCEAFDLYAPVVQMQAMSTYLTLAKAVMGSDGHLGIIKGFLGEQRGAGVVGIFTPPKQHISALEQGIASLYDAAVRGTASAVACQRAWADSERQRSDQAKGDGQSENMVMQMAAYRKSMEQLIDPHAELKNASEFPCLAACVASWMISACDIDAVCVGLPGRVVLAQAASHEKFPVISEVASNFAASLRRRASCSSFSACEFFSMQFAAVDYALVRNGAEAGQRLSENFLLAAQALSPTGPENAHLKSGFSKALRTFVYSAVAVKQSARLEAVLPWLRGSCCSFLSLADAKALHREFSTKFGAGVIQGAVGKLQIAMRALLLALQPLANAVIEKPQRRIGALSGRFFREARRRLKLRSKKASSGKPTSNPAAPTGWLDKKRGLPAVPNKRARLSREGRTVRVEAALTTVEQAASDRLDTPAPLPAHVAKTSRKRERELSSKEPKTQGKTQPKRNTAHVQDTSGVRLAKAADQASVDAEQRRAAVSHPVPEAVSHGRRGLKRSIASADLGSKIFAPDNAGVPGRSNLQREAATSASSPTPAQIGQLIDGGVSNLALHVDVSTNRPGSQTKATSSASAPEPVIALVACGRNWRLRGVSERVF